jgi:hypothetical protein
MEQGPRVCDEDEDELDFSVEWERARVCDELESKLDGVALEEVFLGLKARELSEVGEGLSMGEDRRVSEHIGDDVRFCVCGVDIVRRGRLFVVVDDMG